ncbi:MAG TPA: PAS domain S-box protein [Falsiroseomonas sp.]|nr:PAS domain S-box protein [Falsiroseomonas sp.]
MMRALEAEGLAMAGPGCSIAVTAASPDPVPLAAAGEALYVLDAAGRVRFASRAALEAWDRSAEETIGRHIRDLSPTARESPAGEAKLAALAERHEVHLCVILPRNGHWIELSAFPTPEDGLTVAFRDIEHRRLGHLARTRAEGALLESESRFRTLAEGAPVMLWMGDAAGRCLYLNRALRDFWGVAEDGTAGFDWSTTVHPEDAAQLFEAFDRGMRARTGFTVDARFRRADGEWRILCTDALPRFGEGGTFLGMIGVNLDMTETRTAVAALRTSEQRLRLAQEAGGIGAWELDLATGERHWSLGTYRLWGIEPGTPITAPLLLSIVHPEDRERARTMTAEAVGQVGPLPPLEMRIIRPDDGAVRWILSTAEAVIEEDGRKHCHIGVMRDVTEQKEAMERLRLLMRELDHRARNALAVVQAALRLTPRDDPDAFIRAVEGRVAALARAHGLLADGRWRGADLRAVAAGALAPFLGAATGKASGRTGGAAGPRATLHGPPLPLGPAAVQALSMALHELATNAAKHGALSRPEGEVAITWEQVAPDAAGAGGALLLRWEESGGPPVAHAPARRGFGSSVVEATVGRQLGGEIAARWPADGLLWRVSLPLDRLATTAGEWEGAE